MKSSLAPIPATLAFTAFCAAASPAFAADAAPASAVDTNSEAYKKAYEKAYSEARAGKSGEKTEATGGDDAKLAETTVKAKREPAAKSEYKSESANIKRPAPLLDTPQQITVVSQQVLRDRNAVNLKDALKNSPGITFNAGEGGNSGGDNFNMRGFNAQSDIFIDGVRDTALYNRDAFFIEQVEIAKGSSGVYQGRGSTGGSMNLISKTAHKDDAGSLDLTASTANSLRAVADANVDISKHVDAVKNDGVAFRMVALAQDGGTPRTTDVDDRRFGLLPSVAFGLGSQTRVTLSHQYYEQQTDGDYGVPFGPPVGAATINPPGAVGNPNVGYNRSNYGTLAGVDYDNWYGSKGFTRDDTTANITTAVIESDIDDHNKLRNITRYNDNLRDSVIYRPNGVGTGLTGLAAAAPGAPQTITPTMNNRYVQTDILSNQTDYVGKFKTGELRHTLNIGVELQQERTSNRNRVFLNSAGTATANAPALNLYNPDPNTPDTRRIRFGRSGTAADRTTAAAETYGVYVNETLHVVKQLDLVGGLRYDHYDARVKNHYTTTAFAPTAATLPAGSTTSFSNGSGDDMLGWRGGVVLKPTEKWSIYGTVANSFNPQAGDLSLSQATQDLKPEETYLYEIGTKWEPVKDRLSFSLAYFYADKTNLRQNTGALDANGNAIQSLTGAAVSQGIEVSVAGAVTKKWNVFGGFVWNTTEITKDTPATYNTSAANGGQFNQSNATLITAPNLKGRSLTNTPEYSATLWTTYDIGMGWAVGGGIRYIGTRWADAANTAELDDYVVGDIAVYKVINKWCRVQVNVDNVADTRYLETARAANDGWATPGAGRVISGTVRLSF